MSQLLLELFSEELPSWMQQPAAHQLKNLMESGLHEAGLFTENITTYVTPRRLTCIITGLPTSQQDRVEERRGPRVGAPEEAILGFINSCAITRDKLETRVTPKGEFYVAVLHINAKPIAQILTTIIENILHKFSWPKSMRWGEYPIRWVRPLKRILALLDEETLPVHFGHLKASNLTEGHRFLHPGAFSVTSVSDYLEKLRSHAVILNQDERKQLILDALTKQAAALKLEINDDEGLLDEVTGLVEFPTLLLGTIDYKFMSLPPEVLITTLRHHQRYFTLHNPHGSLAPYFITIANIPAKNDGSSPIVHGNERVLRARLEDAKFFFDHDQKSELESYLPKLTDVVFHAKLGSVHEKTERVTSLAKFLAVWVPHANLIHVERAASLLKADLVCGLVGEFPELQGTMGYYYAKANDEPHDIALAIKEHYAPGGRSDSCPSAPISVVCSLADKIDSLVGLFIIDEKPTGSRDPFALRRAALGCIRILLENKIRLPLNILLEKALNFYPKSLLKHEKHSKEAVQELLDFFADRLKYYLKEQNIRHDYIASVFDQTKDVDLYRIYLAVQALNHFLQTENGQNVYAAYKRATNIVRIEEKKDDTTYQHEADEDLLEQDEEKALYAALEKAQPIITSALHQDRFEDAMKEVADLRRVLDQFFDYVPVNCENKHLRRNRLYLLSSIRGILDHIANFSLIEG